MLEFESHLDLHYGQSVNEFLPAALLTPAADMLDRPSKKIRAELVEIGCGFGTNLNPSSELIETCRLLLESLHAGSLAIDDIEDDSQLRRGEPTLHRRYGMPIALNVGSWLYFYPLEQVRALEMKPERELLIYQHYHLALLRAHYGQALDLGIRVDKLDQKQVKGVCLASMELKTGALTELALSLGAILAEADQKDREAVSWIGRGLGVALQMFDDLGNALGTKDPTKKWEDFRLLRPSWFWATVADEADTYIYRNFCDAVAHLPETKPLSLWFETYPHLIEGCRQKSEAFLSALFTRARHEVDGRTKQLDRLEELGNQIKKAYA